MKLILLLFPFLFVLFGCQKDNKIPLLGEQFFEVDCEEQLLRIGIRSGADWQATGDTTWCRATKLTGSEHDTLLIRVAVNLVKSPRETVWRITDGREVGEIQIRQAAASGEYHYRLPTVFHIFSYSDQSSDKELEDRLLYMLEQANKFYAGENRGKIDMKVEFVPAIVTPDEFPLRRPGIHWQYREKYQWIRAHEFIYNEYGDAKNLWNPNEYINIYVFKFFSSGDGVSALPWTPENNALEGLEKEDRFYYEFPDDFIPCVTLNKSNLYDQQENPAIDLGVCTLIHELGHYLGLYHAFEDDFCEDTYEYDRDAYEDLWWGPLSKKTWEERIKRTALDGKEFISTNFEDYYDGYYDEITLEQRKRIRHVLNYSPMIPGPKIPVKLNVKSRSNESASKGQVR